MSTCVEASNCRCFERLDAATDAFQVLAGANGSWKTTLLDVPVLIGDLARSRNLAAAFMERILERRARASSVDGLSFRSQQGRFVLVLEAKLPDAIRQQLLDASPVAVRKTVERWLTHIRYAIRLAVADEEGRLPVRGENAKQDDWRFIIRRAYGSHVAFRPETRGAREPFAQLDSTVMAFARMRLEDDPEFGAARWLLESVLRCMDTAVETLLGWFPEEGA